MAKHEKTLAAIFATPIRTNIAWKDVLALLRSLGADVDESAEGSRVSVTLGGVTEVLHAPHPGKELQKAAVRSLRSFLGRAGVPAGDGE